MCAYPNENQLLNKGFLAFIYTRALQFRGEPPILPVMASQELFTPQTPVSVRTLFVGQRLNLKAFEGAARVATNPLVINAGTKGYAVLFKYGAVVLFDLNPMEEIAFLNDLHALISDPMEKPESDGAQIMVDPSQPEQIVDKYIRLKNSGVETIQIIADVLAKSVALSYYESQIAGSFDRIEPMAQELQGKGRTGRKSRELLNHIGGTLAVQSKMIGRVEVEDKPDLLWDRPDLERFYALLVSEYELRERLAALKHKLELIQQTAETVLGLLQDRRTLHVEWYIVILIVFEILLSLWDRFMGVAH